ncbi:MAG: prepilin peptidase [Planctomycetaceae bacterium]
MQWLLCVPLVFTAEACWHDLRRREIPDGIPLRIAAAGLLACGISFHSVSIQDALLGMLIGFVCVLPFSWRGGLVGAI